MKRLISLVVLLASFLVVNARAQSLADIAAQSRAKQKNSTNSQVIDNDILPSVSDPSSYPLPYEAKKDDATGDSANGSDKDKKDADKTDPGKKDEQKTAATADKQGSDVLKKRIDDQEKEILTLQRELEIAQREARLRAAEYYADAGTMLRDQGKFADETKKTQAEIDAKTQALADAKQKLADLQEEARKSGMRSGEGESSQ
jgi:hypothetical protein